MNLYKVVALFLLTLPCITGKAQIFPTQNYSKGYFTWPVMATKALAANFGELRPNHYHMGLDCKTDKKENMPVIAAADGYIAKVKIEPYGFGRCIYINHPNGLTTLYAHLNDFYPALENYIKEQQYLLQSWKIFPDIPRGLFPVKKGQFIAYSGNTGGSQGPHVHFEIRDTETDKVLNPLLFGFGIKDNIAPDVLRIAVYDRSVSTYEQTPKFFPLKKLNGVYVTTPSLLTLYTGKVSFGITAFDRYTGSANKNGIYEAVLYDNDNAVVGFRLDSISYDETRYLNAHIDFRFRGGGGSFVQHLSRLPGYPPGVYKEAGGDGVININDGELHRIMIEVKDTDGNKSVVKFAIQGAKGSIEKTIAGDSHFFDTAAFHPGYVNIFENNSVRFYMGQNQLYDSIRFRYKEIIPARGYPVYQLHNGNIPVHAMFSVQIKNTTASHPGKMVMHHWWNGRNNYARAVNNNGWYTAGFRAFGNFQLMEDTSSPVITPVGFRDGMSVAKLNRLAFVIKDDTEELKNFSAELDGKWLRFSNDKGRTFIYKFDEHCGPGEHVLKISVEDVAGNRTEKRYNFTR